MLFDLKLKDTGEVSSQADVTESSAPGEVLNAASIKQFKALLGLLEQNKHYHFWTGGQWSMHELALYIISIIGVADLYLTTWAMTEDPVREYMNILNRGIIRSMHCVFDFKIKEQKSAAFLLAQQNFTRVHLTHCHAKVMVLRNDTWGVSIPGSANQTRNPRIEYGTVCTDRVIADANISYIERIISGEPVFKVRL